MIQTFARRGAARGGKCLNRTTRRLLGDIVIERDNVTFYLPVTTSILVSVVLSVILWLLGR